MVARYIPRILHHIAVPAISLAPLLPTAQGLKFPTMIFSHGLGGTRLAYSHICGSMASYGMVVIVPEHRDGSAPVTFIKSGSTSTETEIKGPTPGSNEPGIDASSAEGDAPRVQIDHTSYPHTVTDETADGRNRQLEIRLWELSLIYSAVAKLDVGEIPVGTSMFDADVKTRDSLLSAFQEKLDIRTPGRLIWAGHSFGSSTMIQMIKSVYYAKNPPASSPGQPLYTPDLSAGPATTGSLSLAEQITATTPLLLLDIWCLPLLGKRTRPLWKQPLPQIGTGNADRVFIVMSENFFKWRENMEGVRRVLSKDPGQHKNSDMEAVFGTSRPSSPDSNDPVAVVRGNTKPPIYYVKGSAHLNQSDFGILFPRAIKKGADPELILDLNVRAACQWLRESGYDAIGGEKEDGMLGGKDYGAGDLAPERWIRIDLDIQG